jgi:hypothetical protein
MACLALATDVSGFRKTSGQSLLVRFKDVFAQAKTGVKKRPIVLVRTVEVLDQD